MMLRLSQFVAGWLILSAVLQYALTWFYVWVFKRRSHSEPTIWPKAGILLSLRGGDEDLPEALRSLMNQDYPDYELHIVVDSKEDPAWPIVAQEVAASSKGNVFVEILQSRPATCSPHCASLAQAARSAKSCEILALVDGDVVAPHGWLKTLVAGLDDQSIGLVHGNRWYRFDQSEWGAAVRYCWNSAAVVMMSLFGIPWGGSSAMRRKDMFDSGLVDAWLTTLNQDNPAKVKMNAFGKRIKFLPDLMILNHDGISLPVCTEFLTRQLLWSRIYSPTRHWVYLLIHGWSVLAIELLATGLLLAGVITGNISVAVISGVGLAALLLAIPLGLLRNEKTVREALARRGEIITPLTWRGAVGLLPAAFVSQAVYAVTLLKATVRQRIQWRGVEYEILGPWQNRVAEDSVSNVTSVNERAA